MKASIAPKIALVCCLFTGVFLLTPQAHAQGIPYQFEAVVCTGIAPGCNNAYLALSKGPSINNNSRIAFIELEANNFKRVFLLDNGTAVRNFLLYPPQSISTYLQVNDADQITWQEEDTNTGITYVKRLDNNSGGVTIANGASDGFSRFEYVMPWPTLSNTGLVVFGADLLTFDSAKTVLGSRAGGTGQHNVSPGLTNFPELYPMVDNFDDVVVKFGGNPASPLYFIPDSTLQTGAVMANSTDYTVIGNQPGISDNGRLLGFMANHQTLGKGIYARVDDTGFHNFLAPFKISDVTTNDDNDYNYRVGLNRFITGVDQYDYIATYLAKNPSGVLGLYVRKITFFNFDSPVISPPTLLAQVGQTIGNFNITVNEIGIYDPVNTKGEVVFWVRTAAGTQAIILAKPQHITGTVSIYNGATYTRASAIPLTLSATSAAGNIVQMRFSNDNTNWSAWENYATTKNLWILNYTTQGTKTVYVQFRDSAGNVSPSISDTIIYDSIAPVVGNVTLTNNGSMRTITVPVTESASGISRVGMIAAKATINTTTNSFSYPAIRNANMTAQGNNYSASIESTWIGTNGFVVKVTAVDGAGNYASTGLYWYNGTSFIPPDRTAPTPNPSGLTATVLSETQIRLQWTGSTDGSGYVNYEIYRDGSYVGSTPRTTQSTITYTNSGLASGTSYSYRVLAKDIWGNRSGQTPAVTAKTLGIPPGTYNPGDTVRTIGEAELYSEPAIDLGQPIGYIRNGVGVVQQGRASEYDSYYVCFDTYDSLEGSNCGWVGGFSLEKIFVP